MDLFANSNLLQSLAGPLDLALLLLTSVAFGFVISFLYRSTHRGFSYSQSFSVAVLLITVITTLIIVLVEDNIARAIGIFGAFSIIRFRTAVKDVRDIVYIFFALAIGLAVGVRAIAAGVVGLSIIGLLIMFLHKTNFGGLRKLEYVLNFRLDTDKSSGDTFEGILRAFLRNKTLLHVEAKDRGKVLDYTFEISLKNDDLLEEFVSKLQMLSGVYDVSVVSSKNDIEY